MEPKVSIVIPVYNGADFLQQAIESALSQTYGNIEIIVVNDGSSDAGATERIALGYGDRIRYYSKPNGGVASALNHAVGEMTGDYFSWLSHDDLYTTDKIEQEIAVLAGLDPTERARTIVYSDYAVFSSTPERATAVRLHGVAPEQFRYWITVQNSLHGCTLLIPRTAFDTCGLFNETLRTTQDFDLWFRMAGEYRFTHIPAVLVKARSHAEQGSIKMAATALAECNALLIDFTNKLTKTELLTGSRSTEAMAYAEIAASLWRRGFVAAAKVATKRLMPKLAGVSFRSKARIAMMIVRAPLESQARSVLRKLLPAPIRLKVRGFFATPGNTSSGAGMSIDPLKEKFSEIYANNIFGGRKSRSGEGSDLDQTAIIRRELPALLKDIGAHSLLDAPCGDWYWMQKTDLDIETYIGVDIVEALIEKNRQAFGNEKTRFQSLNLTEDDLPKVDVIFSRDCLVHLSFDDAWRIISNFKRSGAKYLLTTTFSDRTQNTDLIGRDSFWRPLNLQAAPFNFPPPIRMINEGCTEERGRYRDKCLGLWMLEEIEATSERAI